MSTRQPLTDDVLIFERIDSFESWFGGVAILGFGCFFSGSAWVVGGHVPTFVWVTSTICVAIASFFIGLRSRVVYLAQAEEVRSRTLFFGLLLRDRVLGSPPFAVRIQVERKENSSDSKPKWLFYLWINDSRTFMTSYTSGADAKAAARLVRMRLRKVSRH